MNKADYFTYGVGALDPDAYERGRERYHIECADCGGFMHEMSSHVTDYGRICEECHIEREKPETKRDFAFGIGVIVAFLEWLQEEEFNEERSKVVSILDDFIEYGPLDYDVWRKTGKAKLK